MRYHPPVKCQKYNVPGIGDSPDNASALPKVGPHLMRSAIMEMMAIETILQNIEKNVQNDFDTNRRILSFDEYLSVLTQNPDQQLRASAHYMADMFDFYGKEEVEPITSSVDQSRVYHFKLFDFPVEGFTGNLVGHESVQTEIYNSLRAFVRQGMNNKLILLHGPNGSAKSTIIRSIMGALEKYSKEPEGSVYSFKWIFPHESNTKGKIGIGKPYSQNTSSLDSYARLEDEDVSSRIPCDLKDHPLLLIPKQYRREILIEILGEEKGARLWKELPQYFASGSLCHRCHEIFENLLTAHKGDFKKVLMHVQVERFYFSRRYRKGLVTVEPQMHVDAHFSQLTLDKSIAGLPSSLQSMNFFSLSGDLIDGNRGVIEYSDLLKRPVDTFKYLLSSCETGSVNVGSSIAHLDGVMLGSSNELQLDAFKDFPDFSSFKARIDLIRVPYLMQVNKEAQIYEQTIEQFGGSKHIAPHVAWTVALWSILTRLKKPNSINYAPNVSSIISHLSPIDKARLYNDLEMPAALSAEDRKVLRSNVGNLLEEYKNIPYYEGRVGASPREIKSILFEASQNPEFQCLSPLSVMKELDSFVKRISEYDFLKQDVKEGYHDAVEFIKLTRNEYLNRVDNEVRESMELYDASQWEDFIRKYVNEISALLKNEKVKNEVTGKAEDPDNSLITEFEKIMGAPSDPKELTQFRQTFISQVGAWSLDHPGQSVRYSEVFPEHWKKLEKHYFESQKAVLTKMRNAIQVYGTDEYDPHSEGSQMAKETISNLKNKKGYCDNCAQEIIMFLMQSRY